MKNKIYLDHAATTPIDPRVLKEMMPYLTNKFGNASSIHSFGEEAAAGVKKARSIITGFLGCKEEELIFTSGATESNNLAIQGFLKNIQKIKSRNFIPHIITSTIEHPAILEIFRDMAKAGMEVTYVGVDKEGVINPQEVEKSIKDNTVLISVMYVNNEVGTIQPIAEIGRILNKINSARTKQGKERIIFHTDATQAVNYCNCDVRYLGAGMLSLSGHKIYGPKGIGALYVSSEIKLTPLFLGGHQEKGVRSGTYNTPGIVGLGKAIELVSKENNKKILNLRDKVIKEVLKRIPESFVNGSIKQRIPSNINLSFKDVDGEGVLTMLDIAGIAVSTGSACTSGSADESHVLNAMGVPGELAKSGIRITLGRENNMQEINYFINNLVNAIAKLRKISVSE